MEPDVKPGVLWSGAVCWTGFRAPGLGHAELSDSPLRHIPATTRCSLTRTNPDQLL